jgi:26-hydroxylase
VNSEGRLWKEQRRFLHQKLRQFGMKYIGAGKEHMETRIMVSGANLSAQGLGNNRPRENTETRH